MTRAASVTRVLILTARKINAVEAERFGLVNRIAPEGKLMETSLALARQIGVLYERRHTRLIEAYGGIARVMPATMRAPLSVAPTD